MEYLSNLRLNNLPHDSEINKVKQRNSSNTVKMGGHKWRVKSRVKETEVERVFLVTVEVSGDAGNSEAPMSVMTTAVTDRLWSLNEHA